MRVLVPMPLALGSTPFAAIVPATWVPWSELAVVESPTVTLPTNSTWLVRARASSQTPTVMPSPLRV